MRKKPLKDPAPLPEPLTEPMRKAKPQTPPESLPEQEETTEQSTGEPAIATDDEGAIRELIKQKKAYLNGAEMVLCSAKEMAERCEREVDEVKKEIQSLEGKLRLAERRRLTDGEKGQGPDGVNKAVTSEPLLIDPEWGHFANTRVWDGIKNLAKAVTESGTGMSGKRLPLSHGGVDLPPLGKVLLP